MAVTFYRESQYFTTTLAVVGGINNSITTGIVVQSVTGIDDTTKPGIALLSYADPLDTATAEWITYTSINSTTKTFVGVTRGAEGYSAKTHANGVVVAFPHSKSHINEIAKALAGEDSGVTLSSPVINTSISGTAIVDEDNMASNSATKVPTQQSVKAYVDANTSPVDGWIPVSGTWTYASASTITVPSGAASLYKIGDKIKLTQTTVKYFYVVTVADTLLTVSGGSDYTVANAAITSVYYSHTENPIGFPGYFNYIPTPTNFVVGNGTLSGRFTKIMSTVFWYVNFTMGSTSSVSGLITFSVPSTISYFDYGRGVIGDSGTGIYDAWVNNESSTTVSIKVWNTAGTYSGAVNSSGTVPMTWTTNDTFSVSGKYQE